MNKDQLINKLVVVSDYLDRVELGVYAAHVRDAMDALNEESPGENILSEVKPATILQEINSFNMTDKDVWLDYLRMFVHKDLENGDYRIKTAMDRSDLILEQIHKRFDENGKLRKDE